MAEKKDRRQYYKDYYNKPANKEKAIERAKRYYQDNKAAITIKRRQARENAKQAESELSDNQ